MQGLEKLTIIKIENRVFVVDCNLSKYVGVMFYAFDHVSCKKCLS